MTQEMVITQRIDTDTIEVKVNNIKQLVHIPYLKYLKEYLKDKLKIKDPMKLLGAEERKLFGVKE